MKKLFSVLALLTIMLQVHAQKPAEDKSKRPSPPAEVSQKIATGATITINYSKPSIKGRTVGVDIEPMPGKVWRTGANEATWFETDKDVTIDGMKLPAGKYGMFTIFNGDKAILIFNKTWEQWGAFKYKKEDDALHIDLKVNVQNPPTEQLTFTIDKKGKVQLTWGPKMVEFIVK
ncbi:MAG: DUF2911 domain-containing protein [Ginsengibacter sp.]